MALGRRTKLPAKTSTERSPGPPAPSAPRAPSSDAVAIRAYELWRESGGAHGNDQAHWYQAERELRARTTMR